MIARAETQDKRIVTAGIDSALTKSAICTLAEGAFRPLLVRMPKQRGACRLDAIAGRMLAVLEGAGPYLSLVALEGYSYGSTGKVFELGEIGGLLKVEMYRRGINYVVVPPTVLKLFVTGNGMASKEKMMASMEKEYGVVTEVDDVADAAGLARFAYVYLTGDTTRRCELEAVRTVRRSNNDARPKRAKSGRAKERRVVYL